MVKKLVSESLGDILKPKSTEEIQANMKYADPYDFYHIEGPPGEKPWPIEIQPLIFQIWDDFKREFPQYVTDALKAEHMGSMGKHVEFSAEKDGRKMWIKTMPGNEVMFKIFPFKKIRGLKDIRIANNYMLQNMDQYHILVSKIF